MTRERWNYIKNLTLGPGRYIHVSKPLIDTPLGRAVSPAPGITYRSRAAILGIQPRPN